MLYQLELLYSLSKKIGPHFRNFFVIHPRKNFLNQNDAEFDFSIGNDIVLFLGFYE